MPDEPTTLTPEQQAAVQAEIQRVAAGIRDEARNSERTRIDAYLAEQAEAQRLEALEGEERLRAELAAAQATATQAQEQARRATAAAEARTALLAANFNATTINDALTLLGDPLELDLDEAVPALAQRLPALLATTTGDTPPPGVPPAKARTRTSTKSARERAEERFSRTERPLAPTPAA